MHLTLFSSYLINTKANTNEGLRIMVGLHSYIITYVMYSVLVPVGQGEWWLMNPMNSGGSSSNHLLPETNNTWQLVNYIY